MDAKEEAQLLADLSRASDATNAIGNTCKSIVRAVSGELFPLNAENGRSKDILNGSVNHCRTHLDEAESLPYMFTSKFKRDILGQVYDQLVPPVVDGEDIHEKYTMDGFIKSLLPGQIELRRKLADGIARLGLVAPSGETLDDFFDSHVCTSDLCIRLFYKVNVMLPVSHPPWFYYSGDDIKFIPRAAEYIISFMKQPKSRQCGLCDLYFAMVDENASPMVVNLAGFAEPFKLNETIYSLYCRDVIPEATGKLEFIKINNAEGATPAVHQPCRYAINYNDTLYL